VSQQDITPRDALIRLGSSTAEAIEQVLETLAPGSVSRGDVSVLSEKESPFAKLSPGTVASSVSYVDGVTGANIFVLPPAGARRLAQAMGLPPSEDADEASVSELELSAVAEAANQMMAAAASAIGVVLGNEIEISPPDTRVLEDPARAADLYGTAPHATSTTFVIGGEPCRLIQLVPNAFVVRMVRAIDELATTGPAADAAGAGEATTGLRAALGETKLRVWAELGRTQIALGRALTLPLGAVVDLDEAADAPVKLFVNGVAFAEGHLLVRDGEWAICIDELISGGSITGPAPAPAVASEPQPYEFPTAQASEDAAESIEPNQLEGALT
jgi:flagellar motor switch protein FliN/FliY